MGNLNLVKREREKGELGGFFMPVALCVGVLGATAISIASSCLMYNRGQKDGERAALDATGFVGCGKVGEPMMRMPLQKCAALRGFLHDNPKEGKYIVYTDPDITVSAPPASAPPPAP